LVLFNEKLKIELHKYIHTNFSSKDIEHSQSTNSTNVPTIKPLSLTMLMIKLKKYTQTFNNKVSIVLIKLA